MLDRLPAPAPPRVLVVSDLHLARGRDPGTGRIDPRENFFADEAFGRFLDHHLPGAVDDGPLLVVNGDAFDFIRVDSVPRTKADFDRWRAALAALGYAPKRPLQATLVKKELRYGLRTDDYKTIWKFREIADGHPSFFGALGRWAGRGGRIAFIKGNHDLELHWTLLQQAIRAEIGRYADGRALDTAVSFHEDALRVGNLHIEHGHRFEAMTRVTGPTTIYRGEEIRFPFGSFFNKYVINQLEGLHPFLDNVKPTSKMVEVTLRKHPLAAIKILFHGIRALKPVLIRDSFKHTLALLLVLATIGIPIVVIALAVLAFVFPAVASWIGSVVQNTTLRRALGVAGVLLPWIVAGLKEVLARRRRYEHGEDAFGEGMHAVAVAAAPTSARFYGIVGHTHRMDVQELGLVGSCRCFYLNSGSWAPRWDETRPDLSGRVEYSFLRFALAGGEYRHESLEWQDARGGAGPAIIPAPRHSVFSS